jgi:hypothetical protein
MQLLIDTNTDTLADLRAAIFVIEQAIDGRTEESPAAPAAHVAPGANGTTALVIPIAPVVAAAPAEPSPAVFAANGHTQQPVAAVAVPAPPSPPTSADTAAASVGATMTAPASTADNVQRDKNGLPWDERIHSDTKAKNKDGTWRTRRNLKPGVLESVTAELRAMAPATAGLVPPPPAVVPAPPVQPAAVVPVQPVSVGASVAVPAPPVSLQPGAVPAPPAPGGAAVVLPVDGAQSVTFPQVMQAITQACQAGKMKNEDIPALCVSVGVPTLQELAKRPDLLATMLATVKAKAGT